VARKKHNPGCPCCDGCYDKTFTNDYSSFTNADGSFSVDRWVVISGQNIESAAVPPGADAWFHTIHIKYGDCDLLWDGITFEFRDSPGTITDGTNSSIFLPGSVLAADWQDASADFGTYVTLWVTPSWYAVIIGRQRFVGFEVANNRGSVQVVARDNTAAAKTLKVTAVGVEALEIKSWRIADATVRVSGETITSQCAKPDKNPFCTERFFQSQQDYSTSLTATASVFRYEIIRVVGGEFGDSFECQYLDTLSEANNPYSSSLLTAFPDRGGTLQCAESLFAWESTADRVSGDAKKNPSAGGGFSHQVQIPASTAANPYPKPRARITFSLRTVVFGITGCDEVRQQEPESLVDYLASGKAPASFSLSESDLSDDFFLCAPTMEDCADGLSDLSDPKRILDAITADWDTE
jgi:hypothetical protein